jgi:cysteine desulfurase/selenocysteine lyase
MARIYLDNAATSWPKPEAVYNAVDDYQRRLGAPAGRSAYCEAAEAERLVVSCRKKIAQLIGGADPNRIVFTLNGTDALNLAIHGLLKPGDHVVTSVCEHNSVLRPLRALAEADVSATYVACDSQGYIDPDEVRRAIRPRTRLIVLAHASNVTGAIQAAAEAGRIAGEHGVLFLVDAAQSLGYVNLNVQEIGCHVLAAPGHKGLLGPLGTGLLYIAPGVEERLMPLRQGGTGTRSDVDIQPTTMPDRYEAGNLNMPGIAGLQAGVTHVLECGMERVRSHLKALTGQLLDRLRGVNGIDIYGPPTSEGRVGVVSLNIAGYDPQELAALLDANWSIQTRAGLHCAPRMHAALGTLPRGTLRLSVGHFTTPADIDTVGEVLSQIAAG